MKKKKLIKNKLFDVTNSSVCINETFFNFFEKCDLAACSIKKIDFCDYIGMTLFSLLEGFNCLKLNDMIKHFIWRAEKVGQMLQENNAKVYYTFCLALLGINIFLYVAVHSSWQFNFVRIIDSKTYIAMFLTAWGLFLLLLFSCLFFNCGGWEVTN